MVQGLPHSVTIQNKAVSPTRRKVFNLMQKRQFGGAINAAQAAEKMNQYQSPLRNMALVAAKILPGGKQSDISLTLGKVMVPSPE